MAKQFPYKIQAEGHGLKERVITGADIHSSWNVFHKNPDDRGIWTVNGQGQLQITTNQNGLSGRYSPSMLNATDYSFFTKVIPSAVDDDSFGIHFRYRDNFHFYFIGWDGGGEYNWKPNVLRLYKVQGDEYILLAQSKTIGPWVGGTQYEVGVSAVGDVFVVTVDGQEYLRVRDTSDPYLSGAYGPCASSQPTTWTSIWSYENSTFLLETDGTGQVTENNFNFNTGVVIGSGTVADFMAPAVAAYIASSGYKPGSEVIDRYMVNSLDMSVSMFFNVSSPSTMTTNGLERIRAYMRYDGNPPQAPSEMIGSPTMTSITWSWLDNARFEDGFEIFDQDGKSLAIVGKDATSWTEAGVNPDTTYTRQVRAYNAFGMSAAISATTKTLNNDVIFTPNTPSVVRGIANSTSQVTWYWSKVPSADSYDVYDAVTKQLLYTTSNLRYQEENLAPDKQYQRYVMAKNIAGTSGESNIAIAFTHVVILAGPVPNAPTNLAFDVLGQDAIRWYWSGEEGVTYRIYDLNGQIVFETGEGIAEYLEQELSAGTSYSRYVVGFNIDGESNRSNYAYATTLSAPVDVDLSDPEEPWDPSSIICTPAETEPAGKLTAFKSGIGDNLDLKVRVAKKSASQETFTYGMQLKGYQLTPVTFYPAVNFAYRYVATGSYDNGDPWMGYSPWTESTLNGVTPMTAENGFGKRDNVTTVPNVPKPTSVTIAAWRVEVQEDIEGLMWTFANEAHLDSLPATITPNDIITFTCVGGQDGNLKTAFYGTKSQSDNTFVVKEGELLEFKGKFLNPARDPLLFNTPLDEMHLIISSDNANVEIIDPLKQWTIDPEALFVDVMLHARIINPTQTAWNPLIHNGYYYFNQRENFLYAESKVKGEVLTLQGAEIFPVDYRVQMRGQRFVAGGAGVLKDNTESAFVGIFNDGSDTKHTLYDAAVSGIRVTKNGSDYNAAGTYMSEEKQMPATATWGAVTWDALTPAGTSVEVRIQVKGANGDWAEQIVTASGTAVTLPAGARLRYLLNLTATPTATPVLRGISIDYNMPNHAEEISITVPQSSTVAADTLLHKLSNKNLHDIVRDYAITNAIDLSGLTSIIYELMSDTAGIVACDSLGATTTTNADSIAYAYTMTASEGVIIGGAQTVEFPYALQVFCERVVPEATANLTDTSRLDFKGTVSGTDVSSQPGKIILAKSGGLFVQQGTYTSEAKVIPVAGATLDTIQWNATQNDGSSIVVEVSTYDDGWSPWTIVANGDLIPAPQSNNVKYRLTMSAGVGMATASTLTTYTENEDFELGEMTNIAASVGELKMINPPSGGSWKSPTLDLGDNFKSFDLNATFVFPAGSTDGHVTSYPVQAYILCSSNPTNFSGATRTALNSATDPVIGGTYHVHATSVTARYAKIEIVFAGQGSNDTHGNYVYNIRPGAGNTYISPVVDLGAATKLNTLVLDLASPTSAYVSAYTLTASSPSALAALEGTAANWTAATPTTDGEFTINSSAQRYMKFKLVFNAGSSNLLSLVAGADMFEKGQLYGTGTFVNTEITPDGLKLVNANSIGSYTSPAIDATTGLQSWHGLLLDAFTRETPLNAKVETASATTANGAYSTWQELNVDIIQSPVRRFIKYRVTLMPESILMKKNTINELGLFNASGASGTNVTIGQNDVKQNDAALEAQYVSAVKTLPPLTGITGIQFQSGLTAQTGVTISTQTSNNGTNGWSPWQQLGAKNLIQSPLRPYLRYRVEFPVGRSDSPSFYVIMKERDTLMSVAGNVVINLTTGTDTNNNPAIMLLDVANEAGDPLMGDLYSGIFDYAGFVGANWVNLLDSIAPTGTSIKVFTLSSDSRAYLETTTDAEAMSLPWVETTYSNGRYTNNSMPGRYIRVRLQFIAGAAEALQGEQLFNGSSSPWTGVDSSTNMSVTADIMSLTDPASPGELITNVFSIRDIYPTWRGYKRLIAHQVPVTDGEIHLFLRTARTVDDIPSATWVEITGPLNNGATINLSGALSNDGTFDLPFLQAKVTMSPGKNDDDEPTTPTFGMGIRSAINIVVSPTINGISLQSDEYYAIESNVLKILDISTVAESAKFSPEVKAVIIRVNVNTTVSVVYAGTVWSELTSGASPIMKDLKLAVVREIEARYTPTLDDISIRYKTPPRTINEDFIISQIGSVEADMDKHQVTEKTLVQLADDYMTQANVSQAGLTRMGYGLSSSEAGIFVEVKNDNDQQYYTTGESPVFAYTTSAAIDLIAAQSKIVVRQDINMALVKPAPQQGAPITLTDLTGKEMREVAFLDANGRISLTHTEHLVTDGSRKLMLAFTDIDPDTLEIWVDEGRTNQYTKVEEVVLCNNAAYLSTLFKAGAPVRVMYKLLRSFCVDYNYDIEGGFAAIYLHGASLGPTREIKVKYETALDTGYYMANEINLNPMRNTLNEGFIYITDEAKPAKRLEIVPIPEMMGNGFERITIKVFAKDEDGNPVIGDTIKFTLVDSENNPLPQSYGVVSTLQAVTDEGGMATALYTVGTNEDVFISVEDMTTRIIARAEILVSKPYNRMHMLMTAESATVSVGGEPVKVTVTVLDAFNNPVVGELIAFDCTHLAQVEPTEAVTDENGQASTFISVDEMPFEKIAGVQARIDSSQKTEYIIVEAIV